VWPSDPTLLRSGPTDGPRFERLLAVLLWYVTVEIFWREENFASNHVQFCIIRKAVLTVLQMPISDVARQTESDLSAWSSDEDDNQCDDDDDDSDDDTVI
jgi:hypothetical protein